MDVVAYEPLLLSTVAINYFRPRTMFPFFVPWHESFTWYCCACEPEGFYICICMVIMHGDTWCSFSCTQSSQSRNCTRICIQWSIIVASPSHADEESSYQGGNMPSSNCIPVEEWRRALRQPRIALSIRREIEVFDGLGGKYNILVQLSRTWDRDHEG